MAWIRLSDSYIDHPKFLALSAWAFRLWHEGMAFCRKHQTDGAIAQADAHGFRYYTSARVKELTTPYKPMANPLWDTVASGGYLVHDYLFWNLSKAEEQGERSEATDRMRRLRAKRKAKSDALCDGEQPGERSPVVPDRRGSLSSFPEKGSGEKPATTLEPDEIAERAGRLVERYGELYTEHRRGAKHRARPNLDWMEACSLVPLWDDARLEKLAVIVLKTDDPWISKTDRSFKIFAMKATWADDRLKEWEEANGVTV